MCDDLKTNIQAITLMLDEKKCVSIKACIDHIQSKLKDALDVPHYDTEENQRLLNNDGDKSESGDDVQIKQKQDSGEDEEESDEEE